MFSQIERGYITDIDLNKGLCNVMPEDGTKTTHPCRLIHPYAGRGWGIFTGPEVGTPVVLGIEVGGTPHILQYLPMRTWNEDFVSDIVNGVADSTFGFQGRPMTLKEQMQYELDPDSLNELRDIKWYPALDGGDVLLKGAGYGFFLADHDGNVMIEDRCENKIHFLGGTEDFEGVIRQESRNWEVINEAGYLQMGLIRRGQIVTTKKGSLQNVAFIDSTAAVTGINQVEDINNLSVPTDMLSEFCLGIFEKADNVLGLQISGSMPGEVNKLEDLQLLEKKYYDLVKSNQLVELNIGLLTDARTGKFILTNEDGGDPTSNNFLESKYGCRIFPKDAPRTNAFIKGTIQPPRSHTSVLEGSNFKTFNNDKPTAKNSARGETQAHGPHSRDKKIVFRIKTRAGSTISVDEEGSIEMYIAKDQDIYINGNVRQHVDGSVIQTVGQDVDQVVGGRVIQTIKGLDKENNTGGQGYASVIQYIEKGDVCQMLNNGNISQSIKKGNLYTSLFEGKHYRYIKGDEIVHITGDLITQVDGMIYTQANNQILELKSDFDLWFEKGDFNLHSEDFNIDAASISLGSSGEISIDAKLKLDLSGSLIDIEAKGALNLDGALTNINSKLAKTTGVTSLTKPNIKKTTETEWPDHATWRDNP